MKTIFETTVKVTASLSTVNKIAMEKAGLDFIEINYIHKSCVETPVHNMNDFHNAEKEYTVTFGVNANVC